MTHTFNIDHGSIRLIVSHGGKTWRKSTGISIDPKLWDSKAKSLRAKCKDARAYERLRTIHLRMQEKEGVGGISQDSIPAAIEYALHGKDAPVKTKKGAGDRPTFWEFFKEWAEADVPSRRFRGIAYKRIGAIMGTNEDWEGIDTAYHAKLVQRLNSHDYSENYKATLIAKLKTVMIEGEKMKFHTNREYKKFSYKWETADTIALSQEEVDAIWNAELDKVRSRARDAFIVGVYTAARFSDYSKISSDNIQNGKLTLQFKQRKTKGDVILPVSSRVSTVLSRNGGRVPAISESEIGRYMKQICKEIGGTFNDVVEVSKTKGAYHIVEKKHRWEMISTHTGRRTGATLLYTRYNVPLHNCMMLTGHTTPQNFLKYIKVSKEENARMLADNPFFQ